MFELIQKFPRRYVELCRDLYENGGCQAQTQRIEASAALKQASQGNLRMGPADWMVPISTPEFRIQLTQQAYSL